MLQKVKLTYQKNKAVIKKILRWTLITALLLFSLWYINCLPDKLFNDSTSTVLLDDHGNLLGAKIADDGQWRFAPSDSVPYKFSVCLLQFEDREFYDHYGISAKGIGRAISQNFKHKRVVSGGSTITMQLARIMRKNPARTLTEKILEMILATRMELKYSKKELLLYYASNAPFGNNVVGLDAASWRYYGRGPQYLSWAENATLAVLPNAPGLIYPGKNHNLLLRKRNRLLKRLFDVKIIDSTAYQLALAEPLPDKPLALPQLAPHLLVKIMKEGQKGKTVQSTIDRNLQHRAMELLQKHHEILKDNKIFNGAVMITSVSSGKVLAYVGNTKAMDAEYSRDVNCIEAPRSTGSILKPFLYAKAMEDGLITPQMLLCDVPSRFGSYSPKNFASTFDGAIPANKALARSLNIPMVRLLNDYGLSKFHGDLQRYGLTTIKKAPLYYGLSLILGGAEAKLSELSFAYTQMAQELRYGSVKDISLTNLSAIKSKYKNVTNRACIYQTFEAMVDVNRPDEEGNWRSFSSSQKIAWKTGTSFGFRDAWAIGVTPDYVVAVWLGNADGEGRPGLTGIKAAAPLLFDVFNQLPKSRSWFAQPAKEMSRVEICRESGHRATELCADKDLKWIPNTCLSSVSCIYHQTVHLSKDEKYRVDSDCESVYNMKHISWFVLPPFMEKFYKFNHPNYKLLPDYKPECMAKISDRAMTLQYPKPNCKIYVPIEIDGKLGKTIFEATHRNMNTRIYWHLDDEYLGETKEIHQVSLRPTVGKHTLLVVDENGISSTVKFEVIGK